MSRGKLDDAARSRILALSEAGKSTADIKVLLEADGLVVSREAVRLAIVRAKEEAEEREGAGDEGGGDQVPEGGAGTGGARVEMPPLPDGATAVDRLVWDRASVAINTAEELRRRMLADEKFAPAWAKADHQARMYIEQLERRAPPAAVDPAKDPRNIGAREAVHVRVLQVVEAAEARAGTLCTRCHREVTKR